MEIEEMHNAIMKDSRAKQRLTRENKGANLANINIKKGNGYWIKVLLSVELDLVESKSRISIQANLPFAHWIEYDSVESFADNFKEWATTPRYYARNYNRLDENTINSYELRHLRQPKIAIDEIDITIYPEAQKWLQAHQKRDFAQIVKEICQQQKEATPQQRRDTDRYIYLLEKMGQLKKLLKEKRSDNSYYGYGGQKDNTKKVSITKDEYNNQLTQIKKEITAICKTHSYLKLPRIEYQEKKFRPTFKQWQTENKGQLRENWDDYLDEDEKQSYSGNFNKYSQQAYNEYIEEREWDN